MYIYIQKHTDAQTYIWICLQVYYWLKVVFTSTKTYFWTKDRYSNPSKTGTHTDVQTSHILGVFWHCAVVRGCWINIHSHIASNGYHFYIWHCVPNILLWSILCKTVGLPSSTGESERTARRQFHSPTLRCFRGRLCEVAAGRGPLKQSRWPESNWTLPLRSVGVAPSLGRFWLVFTALKLRYVLRRHIILSDSYGKQEVLNCFTVYPGLGGSAK